METFQCAVINKSVCVKLYTAQHEGVTEVEQSQANGLAEQRVRALRERLQMIVEDARRCGVEIQNFFVQMMWT